LLCGVAVALHANPRGCLALATHIQGAVYADIIITLSALLNQFEY